VECLWAASEENCTMLCLLCQLAPDRVCQNFL
jgi:hypothetical protein